MAGLGRALVQVHVRRERHRHLLPHGRGRGRGELRAAPRPLPPLGRGLPWLHPHPPRAPPVVPRQAPGVAAARPPRRAAGPGGGGGGGRAAAGQHRPHPAHPPRQHPPRLPQRLGAARWARGARRRAAGHGPAGAGGGDGAAPGSRDLLLADARPLGVRLSARAEPGAATPPPRRRLPAAALRRAPRAAGGQDASQRERGERLRLAGAPRPGGHRGHGRRSRELGERPQHPAGHRGHHGAEPRLLQQHPAPDRGPPDRGPRGGRGTPQRRHQVRPPALAGVPGGAGARPARGQRRPSLRPPPDTIKWLPAGAESMLERDGGSWGGKWGAGWARGGRGFGVGHLPAKGGSWVPPVTGAGRAGFPGSKPLPVPMAGRWVDKRRSPREYLERRHRAPNWKQSPPPAGNFQNPEVEAIQKAIRKGFGAWAGGSQHPPAPQLLAAERQRFAGSSGTSTFIALKYLPRLRYKK